MRWVDVSIPLENGVTGWPGDVAFETEPSARIADGDECNVSHFRMSTHSATHVDAPWHFEDDGKRLHDVDPGVYFGEAMVVDLPEVDVIAAADLDGVSLHPRMLFRTRSSHTDPCGSFDTSFVAMAPDAAGLLVAHGVRLVGIDSPSIAPFKQLGQPTHHILLQNEVFIVENLRLAEIPAGPCVFQVLPLPLKNADGAPCRAFIGYGSTDV